MKVHGLDYPGTLWQVAYDKGETICASCRRGFGNHGVGEIIAKKLGVPMNKRHLVCLPEGCVSADAPEGLQAFDIMGGDDGWQGVLGRAGKAHQRRRAKSVVAPPKVAGP